MKVECWAATDTGRQRDHNEDNFLIDKELGLFVVCDGMGGHAAGEVASAIGVETIRERLRDERTSLEAGGDLESLDEATILDRLDRAVRRANARIHDLSNASGAEGGMGTTCSLLLIQGGTGYVAHVGDSRIYRLRRGECQQITDDHSLRNRMLQEGQLAPDETFSQPNAVTRAVGMNEALDVETFTTDLRPDDRFLICSDGLYDHTETSAEIAELTEGYDLESAIGRCIEFANQSGGDDNITVMMMELDRGEGIWSVRETTPEDRVIRQLPHFRHLSSEAREEVAERSERWMVEEGVDVVEAGESQEALFAIVEGRLQVEQDGRPIEELAPGEHFGEMALLGYTKLDVSARTSEPSTLLRLSRQAFLDYLRADRDRALKVLWNVLEHCADKLSHLSCEAYRDPREALVANMPEADETDENLDQPAPADDSTDIPIAKDDDTVSPSLPDGAERTERSIGAEAEATDEDDSPLPPSWNADEDPPRTARRARPSKQTSDSGESGVTTGASLTESSARPSPSSDPDGESADRQDRSDERRERTRYDTVGTNQGGSRSVPSGETTTNDDTNDSQRLTSKTSDSTIEEPVVDLDDSNSPVSTDDTDDEVEDEDSDDEGSVRDTLRLKIDDEDLP